MDLAALFNGTPFCQLLGIEVETVDEGYVEAHLPFDEDLRSNPHGDVVHGGATYALADTAGGAAVISLSGAVSPTVDMRIDYLAPVTTDITAEAEVVRFGRHLAMTRIEVHDAEGTHVATAHGTYKTGGQGEETPWADETEVTDEMAEKY